MLHRKILAGLFSSALFFGTALAQNRAVFTTADFPGAVSTAVEGINPSGDIVGLYVDTSGSQHGFLQSGGNFTSIDYPGAIATDARGISPGGDIVGSYTNAPGGPANIHGYLLSHGTFSEVQVPGYLGTIAQRITPTGHIYGCSHDYDFMANMRGFVRNPDGSYPPVLDVPSSMSNGATPDGSLVVGLYTDLTTGLTHGFFLRNGNFEPFDVPSSNLTQAWDINPLKQVVGHFRDTTGSFHGFLLSKGQFTTLDFPGAMNTQARGLNPGGDIVGWYIDASGKQHGFLRSVAGRD
jgi:uncharacterized membrane protein